MAKKETVKNYKIRMQKKPFSLKQYFEIEIRALDKEKALDKAYSLIGSKHRVPRPLLHIHSIKKIKNTELKNPILREIAGNDEIIIHTKNE
ncbi:MAG: 50S ribosomal protein L18Ae [Asgard group archaeon]|nr:50S ribosomal protein L18Ae [Asgard group archaeon]